MQGTSHKIFNAVLAGNLLASLYTQFPLMSSVISGGLILFSGFPDRIEKIGLKHRGISHSVVLYLCLGLLYFCAMNAFYKQQDIIYWAGYGFIGGCLGHVLADMFSKNGITVLGFKISMGWYSTGRISERVFLFVFVLLNAALMYWLLR